MAWLRRSSAPGCLFGPPGCLFGPSGLPFSGIMFALHAAFLLAAPHSLREHAVATTTTVLGPKDDVALNGLKKFEAAGESIRSWLVRENKLMQAVDPELRDLFQVHRQKPLQNTSLPGCAASCKGLIDKAGVYRNYLFYYDTTRAGLSDRAWVLAHLMALANALCARLVVRSPSEMLGLPHNGDRKLPHSWWWDRYFAGAEGLVRFGGSAG